MPRVSHLPHETRLHLFHLVTDKAYLSRASKAIYNLGGQGSPGTPIKKIGWEERLPAGSEQRNQHRSGDPGKYRLGAYTSPGRGGNVHWYKMTHVGSNSYKFEKITHFPTCSKCHGTGDC
ncbi:MAG: hypothetical protein ACI9HG_001813, partial [Flavobacteriales bacterium]